MFGEHKLSLISKNKICERNFPEFYPKFPSAKASVLKVL